MVNASHANIANLDSDFMVYIPLILWDIVNLSDNPTTHTTNGGIVFAIIPHHVRG